MHAPLVQRTVGKHRVKDDGLPFHCLLIHGVMTSAHQPPIPGCQHKTGAHSTEAGGRGRGTENRETYFDGDASIAVGKVSVPSFILLALVIQSSWKVCLPASAFYGCHVPEDGSLCGGCPQRTRASCIRQRKS